MSIIHDESGFNVGGLDITRWGLSITNLALSITRDASGFNNPCYSNTRDGLSMIDKPLIMKRDSQRWASDAQLIVGLT